MINLEFLQKIVLQANDVQLNHLLIPISPTVFSIIMAICFFQLLLGKGTYKLIAKAILLLFGMFYVIDMKLPMAYGFDSAVNVLYTPILKINFGIISAIIYALTIIIALQSYKDLKKLQADFKKINEK